MKTALLFPGQGSQRVGMGAGFARAHAVAQRTFDEADAVLGFSLSALCFEGPEDELTLTKHAQPAILTTSIAIFRVWEGLGHAFDLPQHSRESIESPGGAGAFDAVAGHSLGEWTALVAAGALTLADAVRLTHLRGTFMQEAVSVGQGGMAAVIGLDLAAARTLCEQSSRPGEPVEPANLNGGGQIVISGHMAAVDRAIAGSKTAGAKLAKKLPVSAPFHSSLMAPAAEQLAAAMRDITIKTPRVPVVSNVTAEPTQDPVQIGKLLVQQVVAPVRWEESVQMLATAGVTRGYEFGAGAVLRGLVKRIAPTLDVTAIGEPHELAGVHA